MTIGCNSLSAGDPTSLHLLPPGASTQAAVTPVVLIRGWRDLWSEGIDRLAEKLQATGRSTVVFKESQWRQVESALAERSKAALLLPPVVLIGFSWGADDVILISRKLAEIGQPVDLLILIDPVTPAEIPPNVRRCINFYQSNGVVDVFPWLRGVPVTAEKADRPAAVDNIDLRDRPDLLERGTSHKTIAANAKVHEAIVDAARCLGWHGQVPLSPSGNCRGDTRVEFDQFLGLRPVRAAQWQPRAQAGRAGPALGAVPVDIKP